MPPITHVDPKQVLPSFYKLFYHRIICKHCGITHSHSDVYAAVAIRAGFTYVPLKTLSDLEYNLPVKVETLEATSTPFCHMCWHPGMLNHLPKPIQPAPVPPTWVAAGVDKPKKAPKPIGPKTYTIDDLDID